MSAQINNIRPEFDREIVDIVDYVMNYEISSKVAYDTAHYCLLDTLGCGLEALEYPACTFAEIAAFIENVSETAGHARTEVNAGFTQNADDTTRHIFTTVVANAFYHGDSTGVTHAETFTRAAFKRIVSRFRHPGS